MSRKKENKQVKHRQLGRHEGRQEDREKGRQVGGGQTGRETDSHRQLVRPKDRYAGR